MFRHRQPDGGHRCRSNSIYSTAIHTCGPQDGQPTCGGSSGDCIKDWAYDTSGEAVQVGTIKQVGQDIIMSFGFTLGSSPQPTPTPLAPRFPPTRSSSTAARAHPARCPSEPAARSAATARWAERSRWTVPSSPATATGLITVGSLNLNPSGSATLEIKGTSRGALAYGCDALDLNTGGTIDLAGALIFDFGNLAAFAADTEFNLFSFNATSTGFYAGTWGKSGDVWSLASGGQTLNFSEVTGNLTVVPEPPRRAARRPRPAGPAPPRLNRSPDLLG